MVIIIIHIIILLLILILTIMLIIIMIIMIIATNKHNSSKKSGFGARVSSRITAVVHVRMTVEQTVTLLRSLSARGRRRVSACEVLKGPPPGANFENSVRRLFFKSILFTMGP